LIVEEYGFKIVYLPLKHNIIANALSHLPKLDEPHDESAFLEEIFALDEKPKHFQSPLMLFPKHNSPITKFNSALQKMTQTSKQEQSNKHHWYTSREKS
jgi:hypothetical protein